MLGNGGGGEMKEQNKKAPFKKQNPDKGLIKIPGRRLGEKKRESREKKSNWGLGFCGWRKEKTKNCSIERT